MTRSPFGCPCSIAVVALFFVAAPPASAQDQNAVRADALNAALQQRAERLLHALGTNGCPVTIVTPPVTINGTLTTSSCIDSGLSLRSDVYQFNATAGQTLVSDYQSTAFDGWQEIDGPNYFLCFSKSTLTWYVTTGTFHDVATCTLPTTGTYRVHADSLWKPSDGYPTTGAYRLTLGGVSGAPVCTTAISVPPISQSGVPYKVSWTAVTDSASDYQVDQSTTADFSASVISQTTHALFLQFSQNVPVTTAFYYRVRATSCSGSPGPYSPTGMIIVQAPPPPATGRSVDAPVPYGSTTPVSIPVFIPAPSGKAGTLDTTFTATTDKPYLSVNPPSGTIPPGGTTVTVVANPSNLPPGANTGTLAVTTPSGTSSKSVSVSLVTPVGPGGKTTPPSNTLIIPVVTHVNGATSPFQSDVRLTNASNASITYQVTFTPTQTDATKSGKSTSISVDSGQTIALNDIAKNFFGYGASGDVGDVGFGALEIRPTNSTSTLTYASSRTYATSALGTFGQFIAAVPFPQLVSKGTSTTIPLMSLQQIAESAKFRTNLGLVEGSGAAASGHINVYSDAGVPLASVPYSLLPGEHRQLNRFLSANGVTNLADGRIEITVESATGSVTAYASVIDNLTTDPLAVMPVLASKVSATRFVVPGMADLNTGGTNFHSDLRLYNAGAGTAVVTPVYYPQANAAPVNATQFSVSPGEVKAFDNVLPTLFNTTNSGGSVVFTTITPASLVATGRTYTIDTSSTSATFGGTYGQFIPGVSPSQGIGAGDTPLQVLQLEESQNFRTNLGLAELTGNAVNVRITAVVPDSKVSPSTDVQLAANEFRQLVHVLATFGLGANVYNARIIVQVTGGTGRVTAYGSVIDNASSDPTYVPAQ